MYSLENMEFRNLGISSFLVVTGADHLQMWRHTTTKPKTHQRRVSSWKRSRYI